MSEDAHESNNAAAPIESTPYNKDTQVLDREKFDEELTRALSAKSKEVRELELRLARADEAAHIFANLFVFLVLAILLRSVYMSRS